MTETVDLLAGLHTGAWLDMQEFPPLAFAVPGIIPEGFTLLVGPPKAGKSWLRCPSRSPSRRAGTRSDVPSASPGRCCCSRSRTVTGAYRNAAAPARGRSIPGHSTT